MCVVCCVGDGVPAVVAARMGTAADTACTGRVPRQMMHHSRDHLGSHYLRDHSTQRGRDSEGYVGVGTGTYRGPRQSVHRAWTPSGGLEDSQSSGNPQTREAGLVIAPRQHILSRTTWNGGTNSTTGSTDAGNGARRSMRLLSSRAGLRGEEGRGCSSDGSQISVQQREPPRSEQEIGGARNRAGPDTVDGPLHE